MEFLILYLLHYKVGRYFAAKHHLLWEGNSPFGDNFKLWILIFFLHQFMGNTLKKRSALRGEATGF